MKTVEMTAVDETMPEAGDGPELEERLRNSPIEY